MLLVYRIVIAGMALACLGAAQDHPSAAPNSDPADGQDTVIVTGPRPDIDLSSPKPMLHGGLWRFQRLGQSRPFSFSTCLPDDDLASTLHRMAGERSSFPRANICDALRLTVGKGQISGRRSCIKVSHQIGISHSNLNLTVSGRYDARSMTVMMMANELTDGVYEDRRQVQRPYMPRWRATATRLGDCPTHPVVGSRKLDEAVNLLFEPEVDELEMDGI